LAPDALAPDVLVDMSHLLVLIVPVLGFFAIGVTLAEEAEDGAMKFPPPFTPQIGAGIGLSALVAPGDLPHGLGVVHRPAGGVPADGRGARRAAHHRARGWCARGATLDFVHSDSGHRPARCYGIGRNPPVRSTTTALLRFAQGSSMSVASRCHHGPTPRSHERGVPVVSRERAR
jgi:hypothetical protein